MHYLSAQRIGCLLKLVEYNMMSRTDSLVRTAITCIEFLLVSITVYKNPYFTLQNVKATKAEVYSALILSACILVLLATMTSLFQLCFVGRQSQLMAVVQFWANAFGVILLMMSSLQLFRLRGWNAYTGTFVALWLAVIGFISLISIYARVVRLRKKNE
ncbi:hypothetical protein EG68_04783 [Paragonimus skrjabini miyazakii]|uniref:Uncharacterized protein n=1 Tax=Paragonimus skrjabini miyazakii TaxID=59628 RepID=A0A8S9YYG3_9TREM|nr:hypothetical protein EG68_04783 [Paragonimus skrjabini miyazakii]